MANFCSQCGTKLGPDARFCSSCGARQETTMGAQGEQPPENQALQREQPIFQQPQASQPYDGEQEEIVLAKSNCQFAKNAGFGASRGNVIITNNRIIYYKHGVAKNLLLGHAVHLTQGDYDMEIPFDSIRSLYWNKQGFSRYLGIRLKNGEHHRIYFIDFDACMAAIEQAMPTMPIPKGEK